MRRLMKESHCRVLFYCLEEEMQIAKMIRLLAGISEKELTGPFMELLYVTKGRVAVTCSGASVLMRPGNMYLFGPEETHSSVSVEDTIVMKVIFDLSEIQEQSRYQLYEVDHDAFLSNETDRKRVKTLLNSILREMAGKNRTIRLKLLYYSLFDLLVHGFLIRKEKQADGPLSQILSELNEHYGNSGSIAQYAAMLFLSESAFSRKFQKAVGQSFSAYTAHLKTVHAAELLRNTDRTVTEIAGETGFNSSAVMQRHFRKIYACSPMEYRKKQNGQKNETIVSTEKLKEILDVITEEGEKESRLIQIQVSGKENNRTRKGEMHCIHIGDARWLMDGDIREQLQNMVRVLGIHYIAVGNLFDAYFRIREGHDTSHLHFERLDRAIDQILNAGCHPVMMLPANRSVTIRDIGSETGSFADETVFTGPSEWEAVFLSFISHILGRYTYAVVRSWIFVFEHVPSQDSAAECAAFRDLYRRSFLILRKYVPGAQIWANTLNSSVLPELLAEDLRAWEKAGILPDGLNLMVYPYRVEARKSGQKNWDFSLLRIDSDLHFMREEIDAYRLLVEKCRCGTLPLFISEWNTSLSDCNPYNDSCAKACHILVQMADASTKAEKLFYRGFSDLAVSGFDVSEPLIGASALLTRDGLKKPSFYAMEFWGRLGDEIVSIGDHHVAATNHGTAFQILLFHPTKMSDEYKLIPESEHRMDELVRETGNRDSLDFEIHFPELTEKKKMRVYHMSDREGAVYTEWEKIGRPSQLSPSELLYLKAKSLPTLTVSVVYPDECGITLSFSLEPNAFSLILLEQYVDEVLSE